MPEAIGMALTALVGASVSAAAETAIGMAVIMSGASMALGAVQRAIIGSPKTANIGNDLAQRQLTLKQPISPWVIPYGESCVGGVFVYLRLTGDSNEYFNMVIVHGSGECGGVEKVLFDGTEISFDVQGNATGKYAGFAHWESRPGSTDPAINSPYAGLVAATGGEWTNNDLGLGHCHSWLQLKWNADLFPNGAPGLKFILRGRKVYDPRTGAKAYSNNFALCIRDYLTDPNVGVAAQAAELDENANVAAANLCDEDVALAGGGTEKRYTLNGSFTADKSRNDTLPSLLTAGWGKVVYSSGKWGIYPAAFRGSALVLSDDDFRAPLQLDTRVARRSLFNGVKGVYLAPQSDWQPDDFPPYYRSASRGYAQDDYLLEDGERIWEDLQLEFTTSAATAQRIAKIVLEEARRQKTLKAPCKMKAFQAQVEDAIGITHKRFGWMGKQFKAAEWRWIIEAQDSGAQFLGVDLTLRETDPAIYVWTLRDELPASAGSAPAQLPDLTDCKPPRNLQLASGDATALIRVDGVRISRIKATWDSPIDAYVLSGGDILVQYKLHSDSAWSDAEMCDGSATSAFIAGVSDGAAYDVRICSVNAANTRSVWVQAGPHTVQGVAFPHGTYRPLSNPLSAFDGGSFPIVSIAAFQMRIAGVGDKAISGGSINATAGDYGKTAYIYYDDPTFSGGSIALNMSFSRETALSGTCRFFVGSIGLPVSGGAPTAGNNDGGAGAQTSRSLILLPSACTANGWANAASAIDSNPDTYADGTTSGSDLVLTAAGFPALAGWFSAVELQVKHQFTQGGGYVEYTKDGGANWTLLRRAAAADTDPITSAIALALSQRADLVQVRATLSAGGSGDGTYTNPAQSLSSVAGPGSIAWALSGSGGSASGSGATQYLKLAGFGFAIPAGSIIKGIVAQISRTGSNVDQQQYGGPNQGYIHVQAHVSDVAICLIKAGNILGATNKAIGGTYWPSTLADASYGSSADLWGQAWTVADINSDGFGIAIAANLNALNTSAFAQINTVRLSIYTGGSGGSGSAGRVYNIVQKVEM